MKKWIITMLITLMMIPLVQGVICEDVLTPGENCTMMTPSITCVPGQFTYDIINETGVVSSNNSLTQVNDTVYKFTFNQSSGSYLVKLCDDSTREIIVKGEDEMASLSITLFVLISTIGLFLLPFFVRFTKNDFSNLIIKRGCWVIAVYLMMLNSTMMATIADFAGIPLTQELFRYMWLFGTAGWVLMGYIVVKTIFDLVQMNKEMVERARMGG